MTALDEQYIEKRRREDALSRTVVTPTGVPGRLPQCPKCDENDLVASRNTSGTRNRFTCEAGCGYYFDCPAPDAPAEASPLDEALIGSELAALISANAGDERIRRIGAVHTAQINDTLRNMTDMAAIGEVRWAMSYAAAARGTEKAAIKHVRAVLARKEPDHG